MNIKQKIAQIEDDDKSPNWHILHQLLELTMVLTGRGDVSDDYTKSIELQICDNTIFSDPYYGTVQIDETELDEEEIEELIRELKKRLIQFDIRTYALREQIASEIFDKPIKSGNNRGSLE